MHGYNGRTCSCEAAREGRVEVVEWLYNHSTLTREGLAIADHDGLSALGAAIAARQEGVVSKIIELSGDLLVERVTASGMNAATAAVVYNNAAAFDVVPTTPRRCPSCVPARLAA